MPTPRFSQRMGYPNLHALEDAGGLDALYVEPGVSTASSTSDTGTPVTISASQASPRTRAVVGDRRAALYDFMGRRFGAGSDLLGRAEGAAVAAAISEAIPASAPAPSAVGHANAEELGAILDTTAEGIVMFDAEGNINSCNRSAEALFGYDGDELVQRNLAELFAPESQRVVQDYLDSIKGAGVASLLDHGRDVLGRVSRRRHHPAVDDHGTDPARRSEFLRGVSRSLAGQEERERTAAGAAAGRSRRQRQGRHAGADQP